MDEKRCCLRDSISSSMMVLVASLRLELYRVLSRLEINDIDNTKTVPKIAELTIVSTRPKPCSKDAEGLCLVRKRKIMDGCIRKFSYKNHEEYPKTLYIYFCRLHNPS